MAEVERGTRRRWTDEEVDAWLGRLLQVGVVTAAVVVALGGVVYLARHGGGVPAYAQFRGEPDELRSVTGIVRGATTLRGRALIQLGLILLVATPVARVAFSLFAFVRQRDWTYVGITCVVLVLLLLSLTGLV